MYGYTGKILRIDLSERNFRIEHPVEDLYRSYIGGIGLAAYYLFHETDGGTDPLGPENRILFMTGPFNTTRIPSSGRHAVAAKSPLTGIWGEADVGGRWGNAVKGAGFDGIIVQGAASEPVYVYIDSEKVEIMDASEAWGKDTFETDELLKSLHGKKLVVQCIGRAGEQLSPMAAIMTDGEDARAAARCGLGAVMGAKKLKALAVRGTQRVKTAEPEILKDRIRELAGFQKENRGGMHEHGTAEGLLGNELTGDLPIRNWKLGGWDKRSEKITGEVMTVKYLTGRYHCGDCSIGCGRTIAINSGPYAGIHGAGPEYETIGMMGSNLLVDDLEVISKANDLCNRYGLDTISVGGVVGFAMECYEYGLLTLEDTGGVALEWGSAEALLHCVEMLARNEGIGELLGRGSRSAAEHIGGVSREFAIETKGLEFPAHEPRVLNGTALSYATSNRGACHLADMNSRFYEKALTMPEIGVLEPLGTLTVEGKGALVAGLQNVSGLYDSLKMCKFTVWFGIDTAKLLEFLCLTNGWDMDMDEFLRAGERIFNIKRLYNIRCGISRKDDTLPPRILTSERKKNKDGDHLPPLHRMLSDYYKVRGWDELGIPMKETCNNLSLHYVDPFVK
jgi:aldehyde:ferredoxin oxidoreductase